MVRTSSGGPPLDFTGPHADPLPVMTACWSCNWAWLCRRTLNHQETREWVRNLVGATLGPVCFCMA